MDGERAKVFDKQITIDFGFLDKVAFINCIVADKRFLIHVELNSRGPLLKIPHFTK